MDALRENYKKVITLRTAKKVIIWLIFVLFFNFFLFPIPVLASEPVNTQETPEISSVEPAEEVIVDLPVEDQYIVKSTSFHQVTAYNSEPGQTDSTPCITANNFDVCAHGIEDTVAANFLTFGTKIRMPDVFGDRVFVVRDRMNKRYTSRIDIWMIEKADARTFGLQNVKIEILEENIRQLAEATND